MVRSRPDKGLNHLVFGKNNNQIKPDGIRKPSAFTEKIGKQIKPDRTPSTFEPETRWSFSPPYKGGKTSGLAIQLFSSSFNFTIPAVEIEYVGLFVFPIFWT